MENFVSTWRDIKSSAAAAAAAEVVVAVAAFSFVLASMEATATDFE